MRGAMLFFAGIVVVVPSARTAVEEYVNNAVARLAAESPYSEIILVSIGLIGLLLLLLMRQPAPERTIVYRIRTEVPGPAGLLPERQRVGREFRPARKAPALKPRTNPPTHYPIAWLARIRRLFTNPLRFRIS